MADDKTNDAPPAAGASVTAPPPPTPAAPARVIVEGQPAGAPAVGAPAEKITASDKTVDGGAYIVRGRWHNAHGAVLTDEEIADRNLPSIPKTDLPIVPPGAGIVES